MGEVLRLDNLLPTKDIKSLYISDENLNQGVLENFAGNNSVLTKEDYAAVNALAVSKYLVDNRSNGATLVDALTNQSDDAKLKAGNDVVNNMNNRHELVAAGIKALSELDIRKEILRSLNLDENLSDEEFYYSVLKDRREEVIKTISIITNYTNNVRDAVQNLTKNIDGTEKTDESIYTDAGKLVSSETLERCNNNLAFCDYLDYMCEYSDYYASLEHYHSEIQDQTINKEETKKTLDDMYDTVGKYLAANEIPQRNNPDPTKEIAVHIHCLSDIKGKSYLRCPEDILIGGITQNFDNTMGWLNQLNPKDNISGIPQEELSLNVGLLNSFAINNTSTKVSGENFTGFYSLAVAEYLDYNPNNTIIKALNPNIDRQIKNKCATRLIKEDTQQNIVEKGVKVIANLDLKKEISFYMTKGYATGYTNPHVFWNAIRNENNTAELDDALRLISEYTTTLSDAIRNMGTMQESASLDLETKNINNVSDKDKSIYEEAKKQLTEDELQNFKDNVNFCTLINNYLECKKDSKIIEANILRLEIEDYIAGNHERVVRSSPENYPKFQEYEVEFGDIPEKIKDEGTIPQGLAAIKGNSYILFPTNDLSMTSLDNMNDVLSDIQDKGRYDYWTIGGIPATSVNTNIYVLKNIYSTFNENIVGDDFSGLYSIAVAQYLNNNEGKTLSEALDPQIDKKEKEIAGDTVINNINNIEVIQAGVKSLANLDLRKEFAKAMGVTEKATLNQIAMAMMYPEIRNKVRQTMQNIAEFGLKLSNALPVLYNGINNAENIIGNPDQESELLVQSLSGLSEEEKKNYIRNATLCKTINLTLNPDKLQRQFTFNVEEYNNDVLEQIEDFIINNNIPDDTSYEEIFDFTVKNKQKKEEEERRRLEAAENEANEKFGRNGELIANKIATEFKNRLIDKLELNDTSSEAIEYFNNQLKKNIKNLLFKSDYYEKISQIDQRIIQRDAQDFADRGNELPLFIDENLVKQATQTTLKSLERDYPEFKGVTEAGLASPFSVTEKEPDIPSFTAKKDIKEEDVKKFLESRRPDRKPANKIYTMKDVTRENNYAGAYSLAVAYYMRTHEGVTLDNALNPDFDTKNKTSIGIEAASYADNIAEIIADGVRSVINLDLKNELINNLGLRSDISDEDFFDEISRPVNAKLVDETLSSVANFAELLSDTILSLGYDDDRNPAPANFEDLPFENDYQYAKDMLGERETKKFADAVSFYKIINQHFREEEIDKNHWNRSTGKSNKEFRKFILESISHKNIPEGLVYKKEPIVDKQGSQLWKSFSSLPLEELNESELKEIIHDLDQMPSNDYYRGKLKEDIYYDVQYLINAEEFNNNRIVENNFFGLFNLVAADYLVKNPKTTFAQAFDPDFDKLNKQKSARAVLIKAGKVDNDGLHKYSEDAKLVVSGVNAIRQLNIKNEILYNLRKANPNENYDNLSDAQFLETIRKEENVKVVNDTFKNISDHILDIDEALRSMGNATGIASPDLNPPNSQYNSAREVYNEVYSILKENEIAEYNNVVTFCETLIELLPEKDAVSDELTEEAVSDELSFVRDSVENIIALNKIPKNPTYDNLAANPVSEKQAFRLEDIVGNAYIRFPSDQLDTNKLSAVQHNCSSVITSENYQGLYSLAAAKYITANPDKTFTEALMPRADRTAKLACGQEVLDSIVNEEKCDDVVVDGIKAISNLDLKNEIIHNLNLDKDISDKDFLKAVRNHNNIPVVRDTLNNIALYVNRLERSIRGIYAANQIDYNLDTQSIKKPKTAGEYRALYVYDKAKSRLTPEELDKFEKNSKFCDDLIITLEIEKDKNTFPDFLEKFTKDNIITFNAVYPIYDEALEQVDDLSKSSSDKQEQVTRREVIEISAEQEKEANQKVGNAGSIIADKITSEITNMFIAKTMEKINSTTGGKNTLPVGIVEEFSQLVRKNVKYLLANSGYAEKLSGLDKNRVNNDIKDFVNNNKTSLPLFVSNEIVQRATDSAFETTKNKFTRYSDIIGACELSSPFVDYEKNEPSKYLSFLPAEPGTENLTDNKKTSAIAPDVEEAAKALNGIKLSDMKTLLGKGDNLIKACTLYDKIFENNKAFRNAVSNEAVTAAQKANLKREPVSTDFFLINGKPAEEVVRDAVGKNFKSLSDKHKESVIQAGIISAIADGENVVEFKQYSKAIDKSGAVLNIVPVTSQSTESLKHKKKYNAEKVHARLLKNDSVLQHINKTKAAYDKAYEENIAKQQSAEKQHDSGDFVKDKIEHPVQKKQVSINLTNPNQNIENKAKTSIPKIKSNLEKKDDLNIS